MSSRVLHLRIKTRDGKADALFTFLKDAMLFYTSPGGIQIRLFRDVTDQNRFIEIVEYESVNAFEKDQCRVECDPRMRDYLQVWRSLLAEKVEVEIYEDVTDQI